MQRDVDGVLAALAENRFRAKFHLGPVELKYIRDKGMPEVEQHALAFLSKRLAPAVIPNDGKQTPWRGHPVFIAQHATGTCCRGCLAKWHHIPKARALSDDELKYAVSVIIAWLTRQTDREGPATDAVRAEQLRLGL